MTQLIQLSEIAGFFGLEAPREKNHVAIVGGGGKTTILHALGRQLHGKTVLTCTTKMGLDQHGNLPVHFEPEDEILRNLSSGNPVMVWKEIQGEKAIGVDPSLCDHWFNIVDNVIVEADGSRRLSFKAPADFEPVVAGSSTLMISTIGADALGGAINISCHRPQRVAALAECELSEPLTPERAARVILHPEGQKKAKPFHAEFCVAITKVNDRNMRNVEELIRELCLTDTNVNVLAIAFSSRA